MTLVSVSPLLYYPPGDLVSILPLDAEPEEVQVFVCLLFRLSRPHADIDGVNGGYEQSGHG